MAALRSVAPPVGNEGERRYLSEGTTTQCGAWHASDPGGGNTVDVAADVRVEGWPSPVSAPAAWSRPGFRTSRFGFALPTGSMARPAALTSPSSTASSPCSPRPRWPGCPLLWAAIAAAAVVTGFQSPASTATVRRSRARACCGIRPASSPTSRSSAWRCSPRQPHVGAHRRGAALRRHGALLGLTLLRCLTWAMLSTARRARIGLRRALVVGSGEAARVVVRKLNRRPEAGLTPGRHPLARRPP